jgi:hypothetical protein
MKVLGYLAAFALGVLASQGISHFPHRDLRRVTVAFPENWPDGEFRPCWLSGPGSNPNDPGPLRNQPHLDCDRYVKGEIIHFTPTERLMTFNVQFEGTYSLSEETPRTCQRGNGATLVCEH